MSEDVSVQKRHKGFLTLPIVRDGLIAICVIIVGFKLAFAQITFNLAAFSFTDFLNLMLALFSVALSVAFYFKATDASNKFYDNTYKFTKDVSEILGRIEAGFGERLRHLDEGYSGVRDKLDKMPPYTGATHSEIVDSEKNIKRVESEQREMIEKLAMRAQLDASAKQKLFDELEQKNKELATARAQLAQIDSSRGTPADIHMIATRAIGYVARMMTMGGFKYTLQAPVADDALLAKFGELKPKLPEAALRDMRRTGLLDSEDDLTPSGLAMLRRQLRRRRIITPE